VEHILGQSSLHNKLEETGNSGNSTILGKTRILETRPRKKQNKGGGRSETAL